MIDEIYDRQFQLGRKALNESLAAGLAEFGRGFFQAFRVLNRIEYQAPWESQARRARCN